MRYGEAGQSHLLPFLGAAALFAALTITAHSVVLGLAAVIAGPVPAAQTALSLSRKAVSGAAQEAASVAEAAPESTGTAASQPEAAAPTGGIESYLVELLGDDARPEGAGAVIEKNYPQGSLSLIHISEPTRRTPISYAVFCLKKKKKKKKNIKKKKKLKKKKKSNEKKTTNNQYT